MPPAFLYIATQQADKEYIITDCDTHTHTKLGKQSEFRYGGINKHTHTLTSRLINASSVLVTMLRCDYFVILTETLSS